MNIPTYYTIPEIANLFKYDESTIRRWIREGKIKASGLSKRNRTVEETELLRFIKSQKSGVDKSTAVNLLSA